MDEYARFWADGCIYRHAVVKGLVCGSIRSVGGADTL